MLLDSLVGGVGSLPLNSCWDAYAGHCRSNWKKLLPQTRLSGDSFPHESAEETCLEQLGRADLPRLYGLVLA